jgi:RecA-family ATPase
MHQIPPRPWAYGHFLLFGQAAVIGAVDGCGKGAQAVAIALAMITGRELLGERVWRTGPVAIITDEDDEMEWRRRIAAAATASACRTMRRNVFRAGMPAPVACTR